MTVMADKEFNKEYADICNALAKRKLKPAFDHLEKVITKNGLGIFYDEWLELNQTYQYMLKYTVEGILDPERQKVYHKLIVSVFELADQVNETICLKYSPSVEYEKKRTFRDLPVADFQSFLSELEDYYLRKERRVLSEDNKESASENLSDTIKHREQMVWLFYYVWFRDQLNLDEIRFLRNFFKSPSILPAYKSFLASSITLSLRRYFDEAKFNLLFDAFATDETSVNQRALVGLLISFYQYDSRMPFYTGITDRLKILNEDPEFKRNLEHIIVQMIRSKETEKLQQRIREDILPEMIKINPLLKDKINLESLIDEGLSDDKNPEWEEIAPGLMDKMEEFSELQMEGADVFMGSFSMLKSFPFFNEIANWLIPFFIENPQIREEIDFSDKANRSFIEIISKTPVFCDSDKYSFCFSLQNLPQSNREFLTRGIEEEMAQFDETDRDEELINPFKNREFASNQYIQDLYRFYKLHPRKNDFEDLFNWRFDFHNKLTLSSILREDEKVLRNIGEYYFSKNFFEEAADIFNDLLSTGESGELYQKIAFCYQKTGNFEKALNLYQKADLYDLNRLWNMKKIAFCYRNLKQSDKALAYYREVEKLAPENLTNLLNVGQCLLELSQFDEALSYYFKVEYLAPGNKKVWRPIGWCSFLTGKKEQAEKYFRKLIDEEPNKHDLMNMGHVQWSLGNRNAALDYYKKSISVTGFSETEFMDVFDEDLPQLINQGIDQDDVPIMLDQLRYFVEK